MVNPTDARQRRLLEALAPVRAPSGLTTYNPTAQARGVDADLAQQRNALTPQGQSEARWAMVRDAGGGSKKKGGLLGTLLDNPVGRGVSEALGVIDIPRRAVWSSINEVADVFNGGDASIGDFFRQIGDETFGAGDVIGDTGNKWVDRAVGFTGDVLGDPLTYLTFGAGRFAGGAGRLAAAQRAASAGLDGGKVARLGVLGASGAERKAIFAGTKNADELAKPGLRLAGYRIKGTEKFAERVGRNLAETRARVGDSRLMPRHFKEIRYEEGLEPHYRALRAGTGNANDHLAMIAQHSTRKGQAKLFVTRHANDADKLVRRIRKDSDGKAIFAALDQGVPLDDIPMGADTRQFLDKVFDDAQEVVTEFQKRQDFAPHIWTEKARKQLRGDEFADTRKALGIDFTKGSGGVLRRQIDHETVLNIDGRVITFEADTAHGAVSAAQINEKLAPVLRVDKVIEDDITHVLESYVHGIGESYGRAKALYAIEAIADTQSDHFNPAALSGRLPEEDIAELQRRVLAVKGRTVEHEQLALDLEDAADTPGVGGLLAAQAESLAEADDLTPQQLRLFEDAVSSGEVEPAVRVMVRDGFERIGAELIGEADAPIVRRELAEALTNFETALRDENFWSVVDRYTQFFKTYATATVGFHVRNGMSAAFMNATDGVSVVNMGRGAGLWEQFSRNPNGGWKSLPNGVTAEQADQVIEAVFMSGGGGGQYGAAELRLGKSRLTNNPFTRASQRIGTRVEGFVRSGMALDTILAGGSVEEAAARITRIHFDYSAVSRLDRGAKRVVPFWTFMSRNVPMQVQQMLLKPRTYQHYSALARNMGEDYEGSMIPLSWREAGAFSVTDGVYLAPDLPHLRLQDDLHKLTTDPQRLLADANPIGKVPFETLVAGKQMFSDREFRDNGFTNVDGGLQVLAPLLDALGLSETSGDGDRVVDERLAYALRNLIPPLGQAQRLLGEGDYYDDKQAQSIANNLGVPLRLLTEGQEKRERRRREREERQQPDLARALALLNHGR